MANWSNYLNKELQHYLDKIIVESFSQKEAIEMAPDKNKAQLLVALAILYKKIAELELKTIYLERALKQFFPKKRLSELEKKKQEVEVENFIKGLVRGQIKPAKSKIKKVKKMKKREKKRRGSIKIAKSL